jgi:hypothetical protein
MPIRTTTLPKFAQLLGQPVTTVKRLFDLGVLPERLVAKSAGKHWRVSFSDEQLQHCKALLVFWSLWRRKPRASKTYARRDELNSTAIKLIVAEPKSEGAHDPKSPEAKIDAFFRALSAFTTKRTGVEGVSWSQRILAKPATQGVAAFILRTAVAEFQKNHGRRPTRKQLAEALGISESSIYRFPFGKNALMIAYSDRHLASTQDEEEGEPSCDPQQPKSDLIAQSEYARQHKQQPRDRDYPVESERRKLRKRRSRRFELAWEEHNEGNFPGGALLAFPVDKLRTKRTLEALLSHDGCNRRATARRYSRQNRRATELEEFDSTFGSWAVAAYVIEPDGKCRWWTNFDGSEGRTGSLAQARREILAVVGQSRPRFPIANLCEMLAESRR